MARKKWVGEGKRFKMFFDLHWKTGRKSFCAELGITEAKLSQYFLGACDPLELRFHLGRLGADVHHIATGVHLVGVRELMIKDILLEHGVITARGVYQLLSGEHRCEKCKVNDEIYSDALIDVHRMYKMSLN